MFIEIKIEIKICNNNCDNSACEIDCQRKFLTELDSKFEIKGLESINLKCSKVARVIQNVLTVVTVAIIGLVKTRNPNHANFPIKIKTI